MSVASHSREMPDVEGSLPAFVERAQQDAQWRAALARTGYRRVKAAYGRQLRESPQVAIFYGIEQLRLWPTMDFVRDWLKMEKRRVLARVRWTFVGAMLTTIVAALTLTAALTAWW
jgi:pheromone shutdown protein TraB